VTPPHVRGQAPGDPVDEEIRREYEKRFGEPAPKVWGERRLISVAEAREWLVGISPTTFYGLIKQGELSLVKNWTISLRESGMTLPVEHKLPGTAIPRERLVGEWEDLPHRKPHKRTGGAQPSAVSR